MNIIEAIKSGKDFKRKNQDEWLYFLDDIIIVRSSNNRKYNTYGIPTWNEMLLEGWEVKEPDTKEEMKFDPTKPVQTRDGRKARIICTDRKGDDQPIIALYELKDGSEEYGKFSINGKFYGFNDRESSYDLINIPEPRPIDIHFGGVYKSKDDEIAVFTIDGFVLLKFKENFSPLFINDEEIVEHLADIQDLNPYIKEKLK